MRSPTRSRVRSLAYAEAQGVEGLLAHVPRPPQPRLGHLDPEIQLRRPGGSSSSRSTRVAGPEKLAGSRAAARSPMPSGSERTSSFRPARSACRTFSPRVAPCSSIVGFSVKGPSGVSPVLRFADAPVADGYSEPLSLRIQSLDPLSAIPDSSTGGRSGNVAISERFRPWPRRFCAAWRAADRCVAPAGTPHPG